MKRKSPSMDGPRENSAQVPLTNPLDVALVTPARQAVEMRMVMATARDGGHCPEGMYWHRQFQLEAALWVFSL